MSEVESKLKLITGAIHQHVEFLRTEPSSEYSDVDQFFYEFDTSLGLRQLRSTINP